MDPSDRRELAERLVRLDPNGAEDIVLDTIDSLLRERGYVRVDKIVGTREASDLTGLPVSTLASRTERGTPGWPAPIRTLACGPLFDADAVLAAKVEPRRGRRTVTQ